MPRFAYAILVLLALAAPSRAADAPARSDVDWSGPWAGVLGSAGVIGDGALVGAGAGYSAQFDRIVIGVDGDVSGGSLDARRSVGRADVEALGGIRGRIGYAFGRFVLFGTGGIAFASVEYARAGRKDRRLELGWSAGGGLDLALSDRLSARAEYIYVDLDRRGSDPAGVAWGGAMGVARLALNFRF